MKPFPFKILSFVRKKEIFLVLDACVYGLSFYIAVEATLLWRETVLSLKEAFWLWGKSVSLILFLSLISPFSPPERKNINFRFILAIALPVVFMAWSFKAFSFIVLSTLALATVIGMLFSFPKWNIPIFLKRTFFELSILVVLAFLIPSVLLHQQPVVEQGQGDSISFLWLPIEWHKLKMNIGFLMRAFPLFSAGVFLFHLWALYRLSRAGKSKGIAIALLAICVALALRVSFMDDSQRKQFFWAVFGFPYIAMAAAAYFGQIKMYARMSVIAVAFTVLWGFYTAFVPFDLFKRSKVAEGMEVVYPGKGRKKAFRTEFMRDVYVDLESGYLFTSYGPTSGLVRINLKTKEVKKHHTKGLPRHFWTSKQSPFIYSVDWIYDEIWIVRKKDFKLLDTVFLRDKVMIAPIDITASRENLFVISTELPVLTKLSRKTFKKQGQVNFRKLGYTKFRSGAWVLARDSKKGKLFVHLGMVNKKNEFLILRMDEKSLKIEKKLRLHAGGLTMIAVPEKGTLLLGDFYSRRLFEIDMDALTVRRVIRTVPNPRSIAYDPGRDCIYAASFLTGELAVVRYADGKILKKAYVGKKPSQLFYSESDDALYFGSSLGVLKIDLSAFLKKLNFKRKNSKALNP